MNKWSEIISCINSHDSFVIMTHTNMDGDAIGSSLALCKGLRKLGKKVVILLEDTIPGYLKFLLTDENTDCFTNCMEYTPQVAIAVDCGDESRIEKRLDVYRSAEKTICIDHHEQKANFADFSVVEPQRAATGLLIRQLLAELEIGLYKEIAEYLYVAIVTDTGRFKYSNTTVEVHEVAAELFKYDIDHLKICNAIYDSYPVTQMRCEGIAMEKMKIFAGGKAVLSSITIAERESSGATYDQTDTCIDRLRVVEGVEIAGFIKEKEPGVLKLSLRAKTYANVNNVASALGGGGHVMAAGATLKMSMDEALKLVEEEIEKELAKY